eukprot:scaffold4554_cov178-Amphora_coffeaeformis.AAC.6
MSNKGFSHGVQTEARSRLLMGQEDDRSRLIVVLLSLSMVVFEMKGWLARSSSNTRWEDRRVKS